MNDAPSSAAAATHLVYMTAPTREEAMKIAGTVVQERLAACANVLPEVTSIYEWQGKMRAETECVVIMKTQEARVSWLTDRLIQLHPYECPCVVSFPLVSGHEAFFDWVKSQTT
jgi:periplasmic divalent cation tolerance protein